MSSVPATELFLGSDWKDTTQRHGGKRVTQRKMTEEDLCETLVTLWLCVVLCVFKDFSTVPKHASGICSRIKEHYECSGKN
jgi:hypothetical protein